MSRTITGSKGPGYDYWSPRPGSWEKPGKETKQRAHKSERRNAKHKLKIDRQEDLPKREAF